MSFLPASEMFVLTLFFGLVGLAAAWDFAEFRIPNTLCLAIAGLYPAYAVGSSQPVDWLAAVAVAATVFIVGVVLFGLGVMGGGDVKLLAAVALWAGPQTILDLLLTMAVAGGAIGLLMIVARHAAVSYVLFRLAPGGAAPLTSGHKVPYGVAIAAGVYLSVGPALFGAG